MHVQYETHTDVQQRACHNYVASMESLLGEHEATHTRVIQAKDALKKMNTIHLCIFSSHSPSFSDGKCIQPLSHFHSLFLGSSPEIHNHLLLESEGNRVTTDGGRDGDEEKNGK